MILKNRISVLVGTLIIMLLISSCSTNSISNSVDNNVNQQNSSKNNSNINSSPYSQQNSSKNNSNINSSPSSIAQQVFKPGDGPILAHFTQGVFDSLEQVDPSTGTIKTVFKAKITSNANPSPTYSLNRLGALSGWYKSQLFDPSLQRMALNWTESSDNSHHVGWLNKDGTITDVSEKLAKGTSDFSARRQDKNALFDAQGNFVYIDFSTGLLNRLNPDTLANVGKPVDVKNGYGNIPYTIMLQPDGSVDNYQFDRLFDTGMVFDLEMPSGITITSFPQAPIQDIVNKNQVLVMPLGSLKVMGSNNLKNNNGYDTEDGTDIPAITPKTDYRYENATVSADGEQVVFVASRGEERALFLVPIDGSSEPKKLIELDNNTMLLFWL